MNEKTIFITGASAGFGAACARIFAAQGNRLILTARRSDPLLALQRELSGKTEVHVIPLDVRDRVAVKDAVESLPERFRDIDITFAGHTHGFQFGIEIKNIKWSPAQYVYKHWAGMYERFSPESQLQRL